MFAALPRRRFLVSSWPWRSLAYVATTAPIAACTGAGFAAVAVPWLGTARRIVEGRPVTAASVVALLILAMFAAALAPLLSIGLAVLERRRLGLVDRRPVASGHWPSHGGAARWLLTRFTEAATWREVAYAAIVGCVVPVAYGSLALLAGLDVVLALSPWLAWQGDTPISVGAAEITTPVQAIPYAAAAIVFLPALPYLVGLVAAGQAAIARALLGDAGGDRMAMREVVRSRARLVDAYEAERRRIERDLHDVAQHRLTTLALHLGMARLDVPDDSPGAQPLARAHEQAKELIGVLRNLIHGIYPQSLTDLGLVGAVRELAAQLPIPVAVTARAQWSDRAPERVESTAYFVISEALTNVAKHSRASRAEVALDRAGSLLVVEVRDDGRGGADPARGTGLTGLADRVAAVNGRLLLASPAGAGTVVRAELPWDR